MQQTKTDLDAVKVKCGNYGITRRLPHLNMKYQPCGKRGQGRQPQKTSRFLMELEQITRSKTLQSI
jgi:hypothetical protein